MSVIKVTFTDSTRSGTSAKGNPYIFQEAFIHVEHKPFPLKCQLFVDAAVRPGDYLVPMSVDVNNDKPELKLDLARMKPVA